MIKEVENNLGVVILAVIAAILSLGALFFASTDAAWYRWFGTVPKPAVNIEVVSVGWHPHAGGSLLVARKVKKLISCPGGYLQSEWYTPGQPDRPAKPIGNVAEELSEAAIKYEDIDELGHTLYYQPPPGAVWLQWRFKATKCADGFGRDDVITGPEIPGRELPTGKAAATAARSRLARALW